MKSRVKTVRVLTVLTIAALFAATPRVARADGWRIPSPLDGEVGESGGVAVRSFYATPEIGYRVQTLPRFRLGTTSPTDSTPFYSTPTTAAGASGGIALGYLLPTRSAVGRHARVELSFNVFDLTDHAHREYSSPIPGRWMPVGGGASLNTGGVKSADVSTELGGGEMALRVATDMPVASGFTITPAVAIFGGVSDRRVKYRETAQCAVGIPLCFEDSLDERVRTTDVGSTVSMGSRWTLARGLSVLFGAGASFAYTHARLNAADCFDDNLLAGACQPLPGRTTSAQVSHDNLGYRLMGQLGLRYNLGGVISLDLSGGVHYASAVSDINNPNQENQAATLSSSGQVGYTGMVRLTIPFGGVRKEE